MLWKPKSPAIIHAPAEALDKYGNSRIGGGCPAPRRMMMAAGGSGGFGDADTLVQILTDLSLTTNLKLCLDAADGNSYTSGEKWLDTSGGDYDFMLGTETGSPSSGDEPTFNGVADDKSSSEYFSFDGGDLFKYDTSTETWMDALHEEAAVFTIFMVMWPNTATTHHMLGTGQRAWARGMRLNLNNTQGHSITVSKGSSPAVLSVVGDTGFTSGQWNMSAFVIDENGGSVSFFWRDKAYNQVSASNTFDASYTSPSSGAAAYPMEIGGNGGDDKAPANTRIACVAIWQGTALTKANLDDIYDQLNGDRSYIA